MRYSSSGQFSITKRRGVRWRGSSPSLGGRSGVLASLYRLFFGDGNRLGVLSEKYTLAGYEDNVNNAILPEKYTLSGYEDNGDNAVLASEYRLDIDISDGSTTAVLATEYRLDIDISEGSTTAVFASEYIRG